LRLKMLVQSVFHVPNMDFDKTVEKLTQRRWPQIASAFTTEKGLLEVNVKVPIYVREIKELLEPIRLKTVVNRLAGHRKIHVQISPKNKINVYWTESLPPDFFYAKREWTSSWVAINLEKTREHRLAMNTLMPYIATVDGKRPRVIYTKRLPPIHTELKARRAKEFIIDVMPLLFWWGYAKQDMKHKLKELKLLIRAELEKKEDFNCLKREIKDKIVNHLAGQFFWDYRRETHKSMDETLKDFEAWFDNEIREKRNELAEMPVWERLAKWQRALDQMSQLTGYY